MADASTLFSLLADDCRRQVLFLLCQKESVKVPRALRTRSGTKPEQPRTDVSSTATRSTDQSSDDLMVELYHNHLPKLEAEGVIRWDRETNTVARGPQFDDVELALQTIAANAEKFPLDLI